MWDFEAKNIFLELYPWKQLPPTAFRGDTMLFFKLSWIQFVEGLKIQHILLNFG